MPKNGDTLNLMIDDISDEGVDFNSLEAMDGDDENMELISTQNLGQYEIEEINGTMIKMKQKQQLDVILNV